MAIRLEANYSQEFRQRVREGSLQRSWNIFEIEGALFLLDDKEKRAKESGDLSDLKVRPNPFITPTERTLRQETVQKAEKYTPRPLDHNDKVVVADLLRIDPDQILNRTTPNGRFVLSKSVPHLDRLRGKDLSGELEDRGLKGRNRFFSRIGLLGSVSKKIAKGDANLSDELFSHLEFTSDGTAVIKDDFAEGSLLSSLAGLKIRSRRLLSSYSAWPASSSQVEAA